MPSMPPRGGIPGLPPSGGDDSDDEEGQNYFAGGERRSAAFLIFGACDLQALQWALCPRPRPARSPTTCTCTAYSRNNEACCRVSVDLRTSSALFVFTKIHLIGDPAVGLKRTKPVLVPSRVPEIVLAMKKPLLRPLFPSRVLHRNVNWRLQSESSPSGGTDSQSKTARYSHMTIRRMPSC